MNPVQNFYENPYFADLKETAPFLDYLALEESKVDEKIDGGKVLDVGCGSGRSTLILAKNTDTVVGIEFSQRLFELAREKTNGSDNIKVYLEDAKSMHFEDNEFDTVAMLWNTFGNLYCFRNRVLDEAKRIIKPDGKIILSVFSDNVLDPYLEMCKINRLNIEHVDENYIFLREGMVSERFTKNKLEKICRSAGLEPKIEYLSEISYWCEAGK